jgi:hypothetical protein
MARLKPRPFKAMSFPQPVKPMGFCSRYAGTEVPAYLKSRVFSASCKTLLFG